MELVVIKQCQSVEVDFVVTTSTVAIRLQAAFFYFQDCTLR